jgi:hypothetical protein
MKKIIFFLLIIFLINENLFAQKIIPIEFNGKKYEVLDMTSKGKVSWGGNSEEVTGGAAKSELDGTANTKAIVAFVRKNEGYGNKPYAAKICSEAVVGTKDDWYLPSKDESDAIYAFKEKFKVEEKGSIWTSTEANANQAITKYWYTGAFYNTQKVDNFQFVCIRKVE